MKKLLIFAGTTEGRELARAAAELGWAVTASVATDYGEALMEACPGLTVRTGRMNAEEIGRFLREGGYAAVIDATHPYAVEVSRNVCAACDAAGVRRIRLLRREGDETGCTRFPTLAEAVAAAGARSGNILAATGSKEIGLYSAVPDFRRRVYARVLPTADSVKKCRAAGLGGEHILAAMGPFSVEDNLRDLSACRIATLVTKDGGTAGGFPEKVDAARRFGAAVFVVSRPPDDGLSYEEVLDLIRRD